MYLKNGLSILLVSLLFISVTSCLGDEEEIEKITSADAQITAFSLLHDSIPALSKTVFTIDQANGLIFNHDSLPFETVLYDSIKLQYTVGSELAMNIKVLYGETPVWRTSGDSVHFTNNSLKFYSYTPEGTDSITYTVKINIHQIDPDSVQYTLVATIDTIPTNEHKIFNIAGKYYLFTKTKIPPSAGISDRSVLNVSNDLKTWTFESSANVPNYIDIQAGNNILVAITSGYTISDNNKLYVSEENNPAVWKDITSLSHPVISVLGDINQGWALIIREENDSVFAFTKDFKDFEIGSKIPQGFPINRFSSAHANSLFSDQLTLVENLQSVWATQDGMYWVNLSNTKEQLPVIEGGTLFSYNNELWFIGGRVTKDSDNYNYSAEEYNKHVFYSPNGGVVWKAKTAKTQAPEAFTLREKASVLTDKDGKYFYIIGGQNNRGVVPDIWQGTLNSKLFAY